MHEAHYYKNNGQGVTCLLCPKTCSIAEGETGFCRTRQNSGGKLYVLNYAACSACALDPIEKKPLYHFYPGRQILSLGTWGCNFSCQFCQNWRIAHEQPETKTLSPQAAVGMAQEAGAGNIGLAFTYSEPGVWYEYVLDTARLAHEKGLKNVLVTNGFINKQPLRKLLPYIDAMNIDVKAFSDEYYQQVCAGRLDNVKHTVELASLYCHVEITTLLVPGLNDSKDEIKALAKWLNGVDSTIPLHVSRYFPNYRLAMPPTPLATLEHAYQIAGEYLDYVYLGNAGGRFANTYCPGCSTLLIDRTYSVINYLTDSGTCPCCGKSTGITIF